MDTVTAPAATLPAATGLDLAALAAANLTPVLGRYFERSWARGEGHHLYDTDGKDYLDFANGIAVSVLGHRHPAVTAAIHAQVDKMIVPCGAMGYAESTVRHAKLLAEFLPEPLDSIFFMNSGSEAIEGAIKLARRVTGRPGIIAFRGAERHELQHQLPAGLRAAPAGRLHQPLPVCLPRLCRRRGAGGRRLPEAPARPSADHGPALRGGRDDHRADAGRGRLHPGPAGLPASAPRDLRRARHPARRGRGPGGFRPDREDVGVRACRDRPGRRLHGEGDRERPAAVRAGE